MQIIRDLISKTIGDLGFLAVEYGVEHPKDESYGDYSANVAMVLSKQLGKNPKELATKIVTQMHSYAVTKLIEKVEVAGPGFINFYLKNEFFAEEALKAVENGYGKNEKLKGQKTFVEFTDPNPFKEFHIGHLMSNTIGESLARILVANGATVKRACYQGDVGLHVAKSIWGWQKKMAIDGKTLENFKGSTLKERVKYLGQSYAYGAGLYETDEVAKSEMNSLNKDIYDGLSGVSRKDDVMELYHEGRKWSLEYFETIYQRLGTKFDEYFFESEAGPVGLKSIEEALAKNILEAGEGGAVVFPGEKYGLHTRVFRNKLGLPTYEGKELGLAKTKAERWDYDKSYVITANEIDEYFKVLIKVLSLLYPELGAKTTHLSHGMMKLTTGKMSSRTGKVITGEGLLNELKEVVMTKMGERSFDSAQDKDLIADQVAVAALKYTVLKQAVGGDITYEPEKITNMEGDTGSYLQYTFARMQSILKKSLLDPARVQPSQNVGQGLNPNTNTEELAILRWIYRYPEVVEQAGERYAPHMIAGYTYELATRFNTFYNQHRVVGNDFRIMLTQATANILKSGLELLGISAPEEM